MSYVDGYNAFFSFCSQLYILICHQKVRKMQIPSRTLMRIIMVCRFVTDMYIACVQGAFEMNKIINCSYTAIYCDCNDLQY